MAKRAVIQSADLLFVGAVFTRSTHPELIVHQRTAAHDTSWELCVTIGTNLTPAEVKRQFKRYDAKLSNWSFSHNVMVAMSEDQNIHGEMNSILTQMITFVSPRIYGGWSRH